MRLSVVLMIAVFGYSSSSISHAAAADSGFRVFVSNERSNTVSVIDGSTGAVVKTFPVGKRPRGIHLSPDNQTLFVATSGSPRMGPGADPERAKSEAPDKSADGIMIIDLTGAASPRQLHVGSDPEEFALTSDGKTIIVTNEDTGMASFWEIASGKPVAQAQLSAEPEGVAIHPIRAEVYVTRSEERRVGKEC